MLTLTLLFFSFPFSISSLVLSSITLCSVHLIPFSRSPFFLRVRFDSSNGWKEGYTNTHTLHFIVSLFFSRFSFYGWWFPFLSIPHLFFFCLFMLSSYIFCISLFIDFNHSSFIVSLLCIREDKVNCSKMGWEVEWVSEWERETLKKGASSISIQSCWWSSSSISFR